MANRIDELKKELALLQRKRQEDATVKQLQKQIKAEKFAQTKGGKIFNKIADVGDAGWRSTKKFLSQPNPPQQTSGKKKKKSPARLSVEEVLNRLPQ